RRLGAVLQLLRTLPQLGRRRVVHQPLELTRELLGLLRELPLRVAATAHAAVRRVRRATLLPAAALRATALLPTALLPTALLSTGLLSTGLLSATGLLAAALLSTLLAAAL